MWCCGLNLGQLYARQVPYTLHCCSNPNISFKISHFILLALAGFTLVVNQCVSSLGLTHLVVGLVYLVVLTLCRAIRGLPSAYSSRQ